MNCVSHFVWKKSNLSLIKNNRVIISKKLIITSKLFFIWLKCVMMNFCLFVLVSVTMIMN